MLKKLLKYRKRARDKEGKFVKDDPNTLRNEAYTWDVSSLVKSILNLIKDNWIWILLASILLSILIVAL